MADIRLRVGIAAPRASVYENLTTIEGLSGWWTRQVTGEPGQGGKLAFYFGAPEPGAVMEVVDLTPDTHVGWRCVEGPGEWVGTTLTFDLTWVGDETVLLFSHAGWREPVEFMHHCSTKWALFLLSLKAGLEKGRATPYPDDMAISGWG